MWTVSYTHLDVYKRQVLGETLVDTAKMLPFLFLAYLLIEYIEHRHGERIEALLAGGGRWGAVPGAVLGCVCLLYTSRWES